MECGINGIFAPPPRPTSCVHLFTPPARRQPERGAANFGWCWTGVSGWSRVAPQGCAWGEGLGATGRMLFWRPHLALDKVIMRLHQLCLLTIFFLIINTFAKIGQLARASVGL
jgi:hypothetical protein